MANTATFVSSSPYRITYLLASDGTGAAAPTITSAAMITNSVAGPLRDILSASYLNQAAMRTAMLLSNPVRCRLFSRTQVVDTTAAINQISVDVDTDAVTATRPEINIQMNASTGGQEALLEIEYLHSIIR